MDHVAILYRKPSNWDSFLLALKNTKVPNDFISKKNRNQGSQNRDPLGLE